MESDDEQSDIQALRKLYGLLEVKGNSPKHSGSEDLDEKSRILLKKLLDGAAEQAFRSHSKIIAGHSDISGTPPESTQPQDSKDMSKNEPLVLPDKEKTCDASSRKDLNYHQIALQANEQYQIKETPQPGERTKLKIATTKPKNSTKRSHVCEESSVKPLNSMKGKETSTDNTEIAKESDNICKKPTHKRIHNIQHNANIGKSLRNSYSSLEVAVRSESGHNPVKWIGKKPKKTIDISEEHIPDDKLLTQLVNPIKDKNAVRHCSSKIANSVCNADSANRAVQIKEGAPEKRRVTDANLLQSPRPSQNVTGFDTKLSQSYKPSQEKGNMPSRKTSHCSNRTKETILPRKMLSQKGVTSKDTTSPIQMPSQPHKTVPNPPDLPSQKVDKMPTRSKLILERNDSLSKLTSWKDRKVTRDKSATPMPHKMLRLTTTSQMQKREPMVAPNPDRMLRNISGDVTSGKRNRQHQIILRPTLLDQIPKRKTANRSSNNDLTHLRGSGVHKNALIRGSKKILPHQQESAEDLSTTSTTSYSSSAGTTQQPTTSYSESEGDSLPGRMLTHHRTQPRRRRHVDHGRRIKTDFPRHIPSHYHSGPGPPGRLGPTRSYRSTHRNYKSEKKIGRLRRLKDKLGFIFHHHHHHHHHHYHDDDNDERRDRSADGGHGVSPDHRSFWKHLQKIFHRRDGDDDRRKVVAEVPRSALAEGLWRHLWRRKKSKPSKIKIERLGKGNSHKKVVKKLHWWQKFRRRRGVRMANNGRKRVRLGFRNTRPQLGGVKVH